MPKHLPGSLQPQMAARFFRWRVFSYILVVRANPDKGTVNKKNEKEPGRGEEDLRMSFHIFSEGWFPSDSSYTNFQGVGNVFFC